MALVVLLAVVASACGAGGDAPAGGSASTAAPNAGLDLSLGTVPEEPTASLPVTVASADGRTVTVHDTSRLVVLRGSIAEVVFALGLGDRVVGRDVSATFDEAADLPVVTRAHDVSAESVLSLRPTLVLADADVGPPEALEHLRNVGVPVVVLEVADEVDDIDDRIHAVAEALGVPAAGDALAVETQAALERATAVPPTGGDRPRVAFLYVRGAAGVALLGGDGSGADSMIEAAGGIDAGTAAGLDEPFTPITSEALVQAAPDALLVTTTGLASVGGVDGLLEVPGIALTPAGRDRRVITVEDGLLYGFGPRTPAVVADLAAQLAGGRSGA